MGNKSKAGKKFRHMDSRGQISSADVLAAAIIFTLIFVSLRGIWLGNINSAVNSFYYAELQIKTQQAINSLVKTGGYPAEWVPGNVQLIGLADQPLVLDEQKVRQFGQMDYNAAAYLLGLGKYNFFFELDSNNPANDLNIGVPADLNDSVFSVKRVVIYKGGKADVTFKVFGS